MVARLGWRAFAILGRSEYSVQLQAERPADFPRRSCARTDKATCQGRKWPIGKVEAIATFGTSSGARRFSPGRATDLSSETTRISRFRPCPAETPASACWLSVDRKFQEADGPGDLGHREELFPRSLNDRTNASRQSRRIEQEDSAKKAPVFRRWPPSPEKHSPSACRRSDSR